MAAYQLHKLFNQTDNMESLMLVRYKSSQDPSVIGINGGFFNGKFFQHLLRNPLTYFVFGKIKRLLKKINRYEILNVFNSNESPVDFESIKPHIESTDFIFIHWTDGFLTPKLINHIQKYSGARIIWIMQDLEPITGGCHYPGACPGFKNSCGKCPQLKSDKANDRSRKIWENKRKYLSDLELYFIGTSSWVESKIKESSLFKNRPVEKIFLNIDENIFKKINKSLARKNLNLPIENKIIFFGSQDFQDERKGMDYLIKSLENLKKTLSFEQEKSILLVSAGREIPSLNHIFKHTHLGWIQDIKKLALAYQSANVFASPSIEDAGPIMVNQSIACGTPVVAYNIGIAPDLIIPGVNGYCTENFKYENFSDNLQTVLFKENKDGTKNSTQVCTNDIIIRHYLDFLNKLLQDKINEKNTEKN